MRSTVAAWAVVTLAGVATTAQARSGTVHIDLPAGTVGQQVVALGRAARINVAVPDTLLWSRPVPAIRGRWRVADAVAAIAERANAKAEDLGNSSWRLVPRRAAAARLAPRRPGLTPPRGRAPTNHGEVVVTASKRDTAPEHYAGQFARVDGADLELGGAGGTDRLVSRATGVASTHLGSGRNKLFIRGIADSSFTGPTQATVGQYFGDLRLTYNAPDPDLRLYDLAAVEVLEGPQGTLYGAGSLGGLIRLVPNPPDVEDAGASLALGASATAHGDPGGDVQAVLNLPLKEGGAALRLVATVSSEGGYIDKPLQGRTDVNRTRVEGGRATLRLELGRGWSVQLIGIGQRIRAADSQYADRDGMPLTRSAPVAEGHAADFGQAQIVVSGAVGAVRVRSTTGATAHDLMERYDATAPGQPVRLFAQANRTRMQANETRLWRSGSDGSGWLAGFSYTRNRARLTRLYGAPGALRPTTGVVNGVEEATLYGEGSLRLLPGLLTTAGLRVTRSVLDGGGEDISVQLDPLQRTVTARRAQTIVLPAAAALVDLTPRSQFFMRYQQGFRPGGLAIEREFVRRFRNDRVATLEAGMRTGSTGAGAIVAALTVARTSWRDIQADFIDSTGLPSTANVGDGTLWTVEGTVAWRAGSDLRFEGGVSFNHSRIDEPSARRAIALQLGLDPENAYGEILAAFRRIPNIADVTARAGAIYRRTLGGRMDLRIEGWTRYVGSSRLGVGPILGQRQGAYLDGAATARLGIGAVGITAGVTNLLDVRGNRFALGTPFTTGRDQVTPLRPRTLRLGLDASF